jgi:hypothetical protein
MTRLILAAILAAVATIVSINIADAKHYRHVRYVSVDDGRIIGGRPAGCPHAYCGCEASRYVFGRIIAELNLAANWLRKFPRAAPAPGMVAARSGHVFVIMSVNSDGTVLAHDGNSGHGLTREHTVSLRGYRIVDPHGARVAAR